MVIKFRVTEQTISLLPTRSIPRIGSKDYLLLQFTFSTDWDNLSKTVYLQKDRVSESVELVGDTLKVPEWFTEQDTFDVTLLGTGNTQEVPTNVISIKLEKSNTLWNEDAPEPQSSWLVTALESAKKAKDSEDAAKLSADAAAQSAADAADAQQGAETARDRAETAAIKQPYPNADTGTWWVWDTEAGEYKDSGQPTVGDGVQFTTDETLSLKNGVLSVNTAQEPEPDNTLPITSAAVHTTVGNIEILLQTI